MRRFLVSVCLLLAIALPCHPRGDKAKPNTLSAKEIADGWILLFDGETTFGWRQKRGAAGKTMKVADGALDLSGLEDCEIHTSMPFGSFEMRFDYQCDTENTWFGLISATGGPFIANFLFKHAAWQNAGVVIKNGKILFDAGQPNNIPHPWIDPVRLEFVQGPKTATKVRNLKLRPLEMKPLFNGKDLTGWKEFPGKKSKFAVTDGAIIVTNGPGDLQTVGKYKDFVLQLECKSNGKHLNSGIFFRCRDNEYQNGYEAQIRNQFTEKPTQKYLIEEYDPKTNKLLGKKEAMFTAIDYGTGAIYRRVPARKELSKDGEWFTMTIVAFRNQLATWVNGVQVTDWTDNRPKSDNARTGCKLEAGHISIQGHDPTTDLSFRNLRIAELPTGK